RSEIYLVRAVADRKRTAAPRTDHQNGFSGKNDGEREGTVHALQRLPYRGDRTEALLETTRAEQDHQPVVRCGPETDSADPNLRPQPLEVFDDAVMDRRHALRGVRMSVRLVGRSVRRPTRMADTHTPVYREGGDPLGQIHQLAFGAPPIDRRADQR